MIDIGYNRIIDPNIRRWGAFIRAEECVYMYIRNKT